MISEQLRNHLLKYWTLSREFYERADYPLASFFAITLIEEVGKVVIYGNFKLTGQFDKKAFRNHPQKYAYAAAYTLLVNSRVSSIYGPDEQRFAKWVKTEEIFKMRNRALYADRKNDHLIAPVAAIDASDSFLLVCFAGEIFAEIQGALTGTGPNSWQRLIAEVDEFRTRHEGTAQQPDQRDR